MIDEGLSQVLEIAPVVPPVKMPRPPVPYLGPEFSYCSDLSESAQLPTEFRAILNHSGIMMLLKP